MDSIKAEVIFSIITDIFDNRSNPKNFHISTTNTNNKTIAIPIYVMLIKVFWLKRKKVVCSLSEVSENYR